MQVKVATWTLAGICSRMLLQVDFGKMLGRLDELEKLGDLFKTVAVSGRQEAARTEAADRLLTIKTPTDAWQQELGALLRVVGWPLQRSPAVGAPAAGDAGDPAAAAGSGSPARVGSKATRAVLAAEDAAARTLGSAEKASGLALGKAGKKRETFDAAEQARESAKAALSIVKQLATEHKALLMQHEAVATSMERLTLTAEAAHLVLKGDPSNAEDSEELLDLLEGLGINLAVLTG